MSEQLVRRPPAGFLRNALVTRQSWDASAPIDIEVLPQGVAGTFLFNHSAIRQVAPDSGQPTREITWSDQGVIATTTQSSFTNNDVTGFASFLLRTDGSEPVLVKLTPGTATGAPRYSIYNAVQSLGPYHYTGPSRMAQGPSGPSDQLFTSSRQIDGYTASAPLSFDLLESGHPPGYYIVTGSARRSQTGTSGNVSSTTTWKDESAKSVANTNLVLTGLTTRAAVIRSPLLIYSDGDAPVTLAFTPNSIVGSPIFDLYTTAMLIAESAESL